MAFEAGFEQQFFHEKGRRLARFGRFCFDSSVNSGGGQERRTVDAVAPLVFRART